MITAIEKLGVRLLARLVPQTRAAAFCLPQSWCTYCYADYLKRVHQMADCSIWYGGCNNCN